MAEQLRKIEPFLRKVILIALHVNELVAAPESAKGQRGDDFQIQIVNRCNILIN